MNHAEMHHHSIDHPAATPLSADPTFSIDALFNQLFGSFSNGIEVMLIVLCIAFWLFKSKLWQKHPYLAWGTAALFFISMHPLTDSIARHFVWLHCLQSSVIHHLIPLVLLLSQFKPATPATSSYQATTKHATLLVITSIVTFNLMSLIWVLPSLHLRLMHDSLLYSSMKWAMALTGIFLCQSMLLFQQQRQIAYLNYNQFNLLMLLPQAIIGIWLMLSLPMYAMPAGMQHDLPQQFMQWIPQFSLQLDQIIGGAILCAASALFMFIDFKRRRHSFQHLHALHLNKETV